MTTLVGLIRFLSRVYLIYLMESEDFLYISTIHGIFVIIRKMGTLWVRVDPINELELRVRICVHGY